MHEFSLFTGEDSAHTVLVGRDMNQMPARSDAMKQNAKRILLLTLILSVICLPVSAAGTDGGIPADYAPERLICGGICCGIRLFSDGVIVTGFQDLSDSGKRVCPAKSAGLRVGDVILAADGVRLNSYSELRSALNSGGESVLLSLRRDGKTREITVKPVMTEGVMRIGAMMRDSTAGLGTVTFYDPETGLVAGLGHPICDRDSGEIFEISSGSLVDITVAGADRGKIGDPGELIGTNFGTDARASLYRNCESGIFGYVTDTAPFSGGALMDVATDEEPHKGPAEIISCTKGNNARSFAVEITAVRNLTDGDMRDFEIRITDKDLLSETGGIVQGMSGSPIIQDGRIIGAVTHVLVNDPTRGYGIFIGNMLKAAA